MIAVPTVPLDSLDAGMTEAKAAHHMHLVAHGPQQDVDLTEKLQTLAGRSVDAGWPAGLARPSLLQLARHNLLASIDEAE